MRAREMNLHHSQINWQLGPFPHLEDVDPLELTEHELLEHARELAASLHTIRRLYRDTLAALTVVVQQRDQARASIRELRRTATRRKEAA
jgi:hypothetical protein